MAVSSPASSCSSVRSSPFVQSDFSSRPIMSLKKRIVERILQNRVTLIVGEAGCGKSSQVPQFLLDEGIFPVLCTQPRRFAVVAVAKMVANARNCDLGEEVGYHIGHSKFLSDSSKIIFKTAGVLMDEIRDKGPNALKYKVIILDEVHERSVESDLILVCIKQFLSKSNDMRIVLMSATADIAKYRDYFDKLGSNERVEVLAIPSANQQQIFQRKVLYLDQVVQLLGMTSDSHESGYTSGASPTMTTTDMKPDVHKLIFDLILYIDENEPVIEKGILVFLPTYHDLEQQWYRLKPLENNFKVHILHSSIETEQALQAMKICKSHRKVILATNIAESSVTIPEVAYVIDSCRSLQVFWDADRKTDTAKMVWVSKSQATQREGRTGRTCDGQIFRLVTKSFYNNLDMYESPAIRKLSLRQQVLHICCAKSRAINDPKALFSNALDSPDEDVVEEALELLVRIGALEPTSIRNRHRPTFYGLLLASFPLSFEASLLVLKLGEFGALREGVILGMLMDTQPLPILYPFGNKQKFTEYACMHFGGSCGNCVPMSRNEMTLFGNFLAYQFWQRFYKDNLRVDRLKEKILKFEDTENGTATKDEKDWCIYHNLVPSSLNQLAERYNDILGSLHRFRPQCLNTSTGKRFYHKSHDFQHNCLLESFVEENQIDSSTGETKCVALPFVQLNELDTIVAEEYSKVIKEVRYLYLEKATDHHPQGSTTRVNRSPSSNLIRTSCIYFGRGACTKGSECKFAHLPEDNRSMCNFFLTHQGCRNGESCPYIHDRRPRPSFAPSLEEEAVVNTAAFKELLPASSSEFLLIFDDTDLSFARNISRFCDPKSIICTSSKKENLTLTHPLNLVNIHWNQHHPYQTIMEEKYPISWSDLRCLLWFPKLDTYSESLVKQQNLMQNFFEYLAVRLIAESATEVKVTVSMNNIKFAQVQVEKLARECFFFLDESLPFDESSFGHISEKGISQKPTTRSKAVSYVFKLHLPRDTHFTDEIRQSFRNSS